jgi:hypothetical protein
MSFSAEWAPHDREDRGEEEGEETVDADDMLPSPGRIDSGSAKGTGIFCPSDGSE